MPASLASSVLEYGKYWFSKERSLVAAMSGHSTGQRLAAIQCAARYFKIARTMPLRFDVGRGHERLAPALAVLEAPRFKHVNAANLSERVQLLRRRIGAAYGDRDLLSASTKLLWLFHRESVVIFDSQARAALGTAYGDYEAYLVRWRDEFSRTEPAIRQACRGFPRQLSSLPCLDGIPAQEVREDSSQQWFRMRVFDTYLWRRGLQPGSRRGASR